MACAVTLGLTAAAGLLSAEVLLYPTFIAAGLLHPAAALCMLLLVGRIRQVQIEA